MTCAHENVRAAAHRHPSGKHPPCGPIPACPAFGPAPHCANMDRAPVENIPLIDVGRAGRSALLDAARPRAAALVAIARRRYGGLALRCGDAISRSWLARNATPYRAEIEQVAARLGAPGAVMLNFSFEWGCTGLVDNDPVAGGVRMLRALDWRLPGLGRHVGVARLGSPAGPYYGGTRPGAGGAPPPRAPAPPSPAPPPAPP